jgi:hypothetical protein
VVRKINLLSKRARKTLPSELFSLGAKRVERAETILKEEFQRFIDDAVANSGADSFSQPGSYNSRTVMRLPRIPAMEGAVPQSETENIVELNGIFRKFIRVWIDWPVYNILDEGTKEPLGAASAHGYKAWPIVSPRRVDKGSTPMSKPESLELAGANASHLLIFRPVIKNPIQARNFTRLIYERAQQRINQEDLRIRLELHEVKHK